MSDESKDGFRKDKAPSKKQLQIALQAQKAECGRLIEHVSLMGPLCQNMMIAHFNVLKMIRLIVKQLQFATTLGPGEMETLLKDLDMVCQVVVEFAAQWRGTIDPSWDPAVLAMDKDNITDEVLDIDPALENQTNTPIEVRCSTCDWVGLRREAKEESITGKLICPICGLEAKEVPHGEQQDATNS